MLTLGLVALGACGSEQPRGAEASRGKIGFIFVGRHDDLGYNRAAWDGSVAVAKAFPDREVLRQEDVPETDAAVGVMESMIRTGATIVFATSFGHLAAALKVARAHPEVMVLHQGGVAPPDKPANFGTYWGTMYEPMYLAGIAAGAASTTHELGFVAAFPIAPTLANINAFELGARLADPRSRTTVRFTGSWCDPPALTAAARGLVDGGVDVLAQHVDCTGPVITVAEDRGIRSVGYHFDASETAQKGWIVGAVWRWGPLMTDIVHTVTTGRFLGSVYDGNYRGGLRPGDNPLALTEPGPGAVPAAAPRISDEEARIQHGGAVFRGPLTDNAGTVRVPAGATLAVADADRLDWLVEGVVGSPRG